MLEDLQHSTKESCKDLQELLLNLQFAQGELCILEQ